MLLVNFKLHLSLLELKLHEPCGLPLTSSCCLPACLQLGRNSCDLLQETLQHISPADPGPAKEVYVQVRRRGRWQASSGGSSRVGSSSRCTARGHPGL